MVLSATDKLDVLRVMLLSRLGDLREQSLIRQGKGMFHVSGMGHEGLGILGHLMTDQDFACLYYRDRALALARGKTTREMALDFFAKEAGSSGGRQMPSHFSDRRLGLWSMPSAVAANVLPACGIAWGLQIDRRKALVLATCGDAATRQGDFYEAVSFARERKLPIVFLVEDNGIGISSPTAKITPKGLNQLCEDQWHFLDACQPGNLFEAVAPLFESVRAGDGPALIWARTERISSHSSADDQRKYRAPSEIDHIQKRCPIDFFKRELIAEGLLSEETFANMHQQLEQEVREAYREASECADPDRDSLLQELFGPQPTLPAPPCGWSPPKGKARLVDAINNTFHAALSDNPDIILFGQDIADPKGGVFSLTKGLSTAFPANVHNSPLAESTILGVACGLASYGKRPVFEIQFIDFIWPGFNQIATNLSTLRWRSRGDWHCPSIIYAPYGGYLPGGALMHSQTNEALLAHLPGLIIVVPQSPEDAAGLLWTALHGEDPVFFLIPKHLLWEEREIPHNILPIPFGSARQLRHGNDCTVVAWGNTVSIAEAALDALSPGMQGDLFDLRTLIPWDRDNLKASLLRTGRLLIVQEDGESCSLGQAILAWALSDQDLWPVWKNPPILVSKPDVPIPYASNLEFAALPSVERVVTALRNFEHIQSRPITADSSLTLPRQDSTPPTIQAKISPGALIAGAFSGEETEKPAQTSEYAIRVPLLGEGITRARIAQRLVQPGDLLHEDQAICELETDKALFPVETDHSGKVLAWAVAEDDEVEVGDTLLTLLVEVRAPHHPVARHANTSAKSSPENSSAPPDPPSGNPVHGGLPPHIWSQIGHIIPTHMTIKAEWESVAKARQEARRRDPDTACSPTAILAWCVTRAMARHPIFTCTVSPQPSLQPRPDFDFGFAVALANDHLDTAVITQAARLDWPDFLARYNDALKASRKGHFESKARVPLIITSMGGFRVRSALPVVVPPAIATLFIGEAHYEIDSPTSPPQRKVELCLSFDHRWINGVAGAAFLTDVAEEMQRFTLP